MSAQLYNNVTDQLAAALGSADTEIPVVDGSKFTNPAGGDYFPLYIIASNGAHEIVHVTAVSGSTLTALRAQEGTDPLIFAGNEVVQIRPTRQSLRELEQLATTSTGTQTVAGALDSRSINVNSYAELLTINTTILAAGAVAFVAGGEFLWNGSSWRPTGPVPVEAFGTSADWGAAFRGARDYLVSIGGGTIAMSPRTYQVNTTETFVAISISSTTYDPAAELTTLFYLPAGVGLIGVKGRSKIESASGGMASNISLLDYSNAELGGFEFQGAGATNNVAHGISTFVTTDDHEFADLDIHDLFIHDVGSYGLANQYGWGKRVRVRDIRIEDTGADGIDWKVRGSSVEVIDTEDTLLENINVRRFGLRTGFENSNGLGLRGLLMARNIRVYEVEDGAVAINLQPGISDPDGTGEYRRGAHLSVVRGFYVEGVSPKVDATAFNIFDVTGVDVEGGTVKWAKLLSSPETATPPFVEDGGQFRGVTVIPAHGRYGFLLTQPNTSVISCRSISDKEYYDEKRKNLTPGQTVFNLPWDTATVNGVVPVVVKNGEILTSGYTLGATSVTLDAAVVTGDEVIVVFPPVHGFRVEADGCQIAAGCRQDRYHPNRPSFQTQLHVNSGMLSTDFLWDMHPHVNFISMSGTSIIAAIDSELADVNLTIQGQGQGNAQINRPLMFNVPTSSAGLETGEVWSDAGTLKIV